MGVPAIAGWFISWKILFKLIFFFFSITEETPNGFVQTWDAPQTLSNISLRPNVLASPEFLYANIATLRITQNGMVHARGTNPGHCIYRIYVCINIYIYTFDLGLGWLQSSLSVAYAPSLRETLRPGVASDLSS